MKIIFLNIWNCTREEDVLNFIEANVSTTDVFCLNEAYEKTKWLLRSILSDYECISDYKFINDKDDFPQATYIKKNLDILASETLLKEIPNTGLGIHTKIKVDGNVINVCNVHGVSKPGDKLDNDGRLQQSQELINFYKDMREPTIIGGDFNLNENSQSVKCFAESGYRNLIEEFGITTTRNRFVWDLYPESRQYFSDYVFITKDLQVKSFDVPQNEVSDHLPMTLEINL